MNGRFLKGNGGGPGNPFNRQVAALRQQLVNALTPERMGRIIEAVAQKAEKGDLAAAKLLWQYGMGKPAPTVQPDRMDVEELALYQEQQFSPEAWLGIIKSIPADMAVQLLRPVMPAIRRSAATFVQQMARESGIEVGGRQGQERDRRGRQTGQSARRERQRPNANGGNGQRAGASGNGSATKGPVSLAERETPRQAPPSTSGGNGESASLGNGGSGGSAPSGNGANGDTRNRAPSANGSNREERPMGTGDNGGGER